MSTAPIDTPNLSDSHQVDKLANQFRQSRFIWNSNKIIILVSFTWSLENSDTVSL